MVKVRHSNNEATTFNSVICPTFCRNNVTYRNIDTTTFQFRQLDPFKDKLAVRELLPLSHIVMPRFASEHNRVALLQGCFNTTSCPVICPAID